MLHSTLMGDPFMRRVRLDCVTMTAAICAAILLVGISVCVYLYIAWKPWWQFDFLEERAKEVVTGAELQIWATNLLDSYPMTNNWIILERSEFGTNFPPQLLSLAPRIGPDVAVYMLDDQPRFVRVTWSSGFLGMKGFEIGSTDFVGRGNKWQEGVYFFSKQ